ncbi:MAG: hypothetical protein ACPL7O_11030 [Armatimonadota bacterium]
MRMIKEVAVKEDGRLITYYWFENEAKMRGAESKQQVSHDGTVSEQEYLTTGGVTGEIAGRTKN